MEDEVTDSTTFSQAQGYSSPNLTVASLRSEAVLKLGEKIVAELGSEDRADTLSRWMAHYIAELIQKSKVAQIEGRDEALARCAAAILNLWEYRRKFPQGKRPLEDLEPIIRVMELLDPDRPIFRYFDSVILEGSETKEAGESETWLNVAVELDYSARILIRDCLARAAKTAVNKSKEWLELAEGAGADQGIDILFIRALTEDSDRLNAARERIEERIKRLQAFREMATVVESGLRAQLEQIGPPKREPKPFDSGQA
jgi:hypothetical protein